MTTTSHIAHDSRLGPARLWLAVAIVVVQWFFWLAVPIILPSQMGIGLFGGIGCGLAVFLWWMFLSRAPWVERVGPDVQVLGRAAGHIVAVRQGRMLATAFHPEMTGDRRIHKLFVGIVIGG